MISIGGGVPPKRILKDVLSEYGAARDETLQTVASRLYDTASAKSAAQLLASIDGKVATEETLRSVHGVLQAALTDSGSIGVAILDEQTGLARDATVASIESRLAPSLLDEKLAALDNSAGGTAALLQVFDSDVPVPDSGELAVQIALDAQAAVKLRIVRGGSTLEYYLNSAQPLAANSWHEYGVSVLAGDAVNVLVEVPAGAAVNAYVALILRKR